MFEILREWFREYKKGVLLITYGMLLYFVIGNIHIVFDVILKAFMLAKPLFLGIAIAFVINILMDKIEDFIEGKLKNCRFIYKNKRAISLTLTLLFAILFVLIVSAIVIPHLIDSVSLLLTNFSAYLNNLGDNLLGLLDSMHISNPTITQKIENIEHLPWDEILAKTANYFGLSSGGDVIEATMSFLGDAGIWFTGFIISLYLLASKERLIRQFKMIIVALFGRDISEAIFRFGNMSSTIFRNFIGGQLVEGCILFALYYVSMSLLKMPFALLISMLIGITSIIPIFGAMVGAFIGCVLILAINPLQSIVFAIFYLVVQQLEDNIIYPKVVGNSVGLPGIWVLLSLLIFGSLMGVFGMLIAVPVSAIIYQFIKEGVKYALDVRDLVVTNEGKVEDEI